jgi:hypothetical protein
LWAKPDDYSNVVPECRENIMAPTSAACVELMHNSQKAAAEMELERRFKVFETKFSDDDARF